MAENAIIETIDQLEWLEPVGDAVKSAVTGTFGAAGAAGQKVKNALHGTWLGHPLHPVMTDIPLGSWTAALVFDLLDQSCHSEATARGAKMAVAIGLAGAAGSAITGLTDWSDTDGRPRRVGFVHALLNVAATALYTASLLKRSGRHGRRRRGAARAFAYAGFAAVCASSWLGGDLVYSEQIGVNHAVGPEPPVDFTPAIPDNDLAEGQLRGARVNGLDILIARKDGKVYAMAAACSHLGGPLPEGALEEDYVRCPWHGSCFRLEDGGVVNGPATHPQPCYETRVRDGQIEIRGQA